MAAKRPRKKLYTVEEANATLPLVRSILKDITSLAQDLKQRHQKIVAMQSSGDLSPAHQDEVDALVVEFDKDQDRLEEYVNELSQLGIELKDLFTGLVDYRCMMDGREVYLCWRLGEAEVAHWHELDAGFAGRKKLEPSLVKS
jgi:hypothetical protein